MSKHTDLRKEQALEYHSSGRPGKIEVVPTKEAKTQRDLSLAYSPGVAVPCKEIFNNVEEVYKYTAKGNLVAVISNGTAVLGLGDIGPEASKPVMEGKGVLFKIFADIDVFDIEINEKDPEKFVADRKSAGANIWRHQSGRHQSAGMFLHRAGAEKADEHSGDA
jgi:malate dehydrogenase (oxaloacetate-decarboxylating)(NADP+)